MKPSLLGTGLLLQLVLVCPLYGQSYFNSCVSGTGNSSSLIISTDSAPTVDGVPLGNGSEIAAFTPEGLCAGAIVWEVRNAALTIWGDDTQTAQKDGFASSEPLSFRVWDASTETEYGGGTGSIAVRYDASQAYFRTDGLYGSDAIYKFAEMTVSSISANTGIGAEGELPDAFHLHQNYPNPFNPQTTIQFELPEAAHVTLRVFTPLGRQVAELAAEMFPAGEHSVSWSPGPMASGVYVYRLEVQEAVLSRTMLYVK